MKLQHLFLPFLAAVAAESFAITLDRQIVGGRFEECEFVGLGSKGTLAGTLLISQTSEDPKWASALALRLEDAAKSQASFRLALVTVTTSAQLEARYEYFVGSRRPVAEALAEVPLGEALPFRLTWNESGLVTVAVANAAPRNLVLDFKPTKATVLFSGARAQLKTEGAEVLNCALQPGAK